MYYKIRDFFCRIDKKAPNLEQPITNLQFVSPDNEPTNSAIILKKQPHGEMLCRHILDGMKAIEIIRDSLLDSSYKLAAEQSNLDEMQLHNEQTRNSMINMINAVKEIEGYSERSVEHINNLDEALKQISGNLEKIDRFSKQTNILAVNSAIEASHVGSRGAGFTVIAQEIKLLSAEIQEEAISIHAFTSTIRDHAKNISDDSATNHKWVTEIRKVAEESSQLLSSVIERSSHMQKIIHFVAIQEFLNTVKLDHVLWKGDIYKRLLDESTDLHVNDHKQCRLGKWYYAKEGQHYIDIDAFRKIEKPHTQVHLSGRNALLAHAEKRAADEERHLKAMEDSSREVILCVDKLLAALKY